MILVSVNWTHPETFNDCKNPIQWLDIDIILASDSRLQSLTCHDCNPLQWFDIDMILASVNMVHPITRSDCNPVQWFEIDMILASVIDLPAISIHLVYLNWST